MRTRGGDLVVKASIRPTAPTSILARNGGDTWQGSMTSYLRKIRMWVQWMKQAGHAEGMTRAIGQWTFGTETV